MSSGSIRELARRVGVSDTAIHKARKDGRIPPHMFGVKPSGRVYVLDLGEAEALARSVLSLSHGAGKRRADKAAAAPQAPTRAKPAPKPARAPEPQDSAPQAPPAPPPAQEEAAAEPMNPGAYQKARAMREVYQAKLNKLKYDQESGALVSRDEMKAALFAAGRQLRDSLEQMPARLSPQLASEDDQHVISMMLAEEIKQALQELAHAFQRATGDQ